jgi:hypothetical protein
VETPESASTAPGFNTSPDPTELALELTELRGPAPGAADYFRLRLNEAGNELSNRYINWTYPAKYYLGYTSQNLEATLGDFYAQLGRGFVLSVRKLDELASDTTVRGLRLTARTTIADLRFRLTGALRRDESTAYRRGQRPLSRRRRQRHARLIAVTEAGMPRAITSDFVADSPDCSSFGTCTYAPDRVGAAQVEIATNDIKLATQARCSGARIRSAPTSRGAPKRF